jgi:hypothetical protein
MASGLLFILLLKQHYSLEWTDARGNKFICNNEGLLTSIESTIHWTYLQPKVMLCTEWDIKSVIITAHRAIGWTFEFKHIHSHQDDSVALEDLTHEVRLNVEANRLATDYLSTSKYLGWASLLLSAKCQLLIQGATLSSKLPNAI